jgi:acetyl esterase/lipase
MAYAAGIEQFVATVNTALPPDYYKLSVERQRALYDSLTDVLFLVACYCPDAAMAADQYVSPLLGGKFHDLPPAYVVVCEQDSLRVDAEKYVEMLRANGIPVRYVLEPGMVHAPVRARRQRVRRRHDPAVLRGGGAGRGREGAR